MSRSFRRLTRHFLLQLFQVDAGADGGLNPTAVLALLAAPGAIMSFLLFMKYSPLMRFFQRNFRFDAHIASIADKYTFLALSMAVTGLVVVLRWEAMFPDRRDFLNLSPLPVPDRKVLAARALALTGFAAVFLAAINLCSTLLFPPIVMESNGTSGELLRFFGAHAIAVVAAGIWTFASFLALTGTLMAVLPFGVFQRARRYVQFVSIIGLTLLFLSASSAGKLADPIRLGQPVWAEWLPSMWFLGLYEALLGTQTGSFGMLAERAVAGLAASVLLAAAAYAMSYRWYYLRTAETVAGASSAFPVPRLLIRVGEAFLPSQGLYRASLAFALRTLARSDRHTAAFASVAGLGVALAVQATNLPSRTQPLPVNECAAVLMVLYATTTGLRLSAGIPSEPDAAWVFRFGASTVDAEPERVVRIVMYLFAAPTVVLSTCFFGLNFAWTPALLFGVIASVVTVALVHVLTSGFRVIPFTCPWLPGRTNLPFTLSLWAVGLIVFSHGVGGLAIFLVQSPFRVLVFVGIVAVVAGWLRFFGEDHEPMVWTDTRGELDLLRIAD